MPPIKNFALLSPDSFPKVPENKILEGFIFSQLKPHTPIYVDEKGLIFKNCNIRNCNVPEDSKLENCSGVNLHISRCSHIHPEWVQFGLKECLANCEHVVDSDEIIVNGVLVETVYQYQDKRVE